MHIKSVMTNIKHNIKINIIKRKSFLDKRFSDIKPTIRVIIQIRENIPIPHLFNSTKPRRIPINEIKTSTLINIP